jgi:hypothetical protein
VLAIGAEASGYLLAAGSTRELENAWRAVLKSVAPLILHLAQPVVVSSATAEASRREPVNTSHQEELIEILKAIQSDIRQIKVDVQSLISQQPKSAPMSFPQDNDVSEFGEAGRSTSVEDVLQYFREKRGDDDLGSD